MKETVWLKLECSIHINVIEFGRILFKRENVNMALLRRVILAIPIKATCACVFFYHNINSSRIKAATQMKKANDMFVFMFSLTYQKSLQSVVCFRLNFHSVFYFAFVLLLLTMYMNHKLSVFFHTNIRSECNNEL